MGTTTASSITELPCVQSGQHTGRTRVTKRLPPPRLSSALPRQGQARALGTPGRSFADEENPNARLVSKKRNKVTLSCLHFREAVAS